MVFTVIVVLGMKRLGLGPFKRLTEDLVVAYRSGGSDVLTLDGLSENHATDISQNRQNGLFFSFYISAKRLKAEITFILSCYRKKKFKVQFKHEPNGCKMVIF